MQSIQTSNRAIDMFGAGEHGFSPGNPAAGQIATLLSPAWCNGVQEEIINVIRAGGLVPSGIDYTQMLQAIRALIAAAWPGPGMVYPYAGSVAPAGSVKCNGAALSRTAYAALFGRLGTIWGAGDGVTTFNVPDMRGEFLRGFDDGRGVDTGRVLGTAQAAAVLSHLHTVNDSGHGHAVVDPQHSHSIQESGTTGAGSLILAAQNIPSGTGTTQTASTGITVSSAPSGITLNTTGSTDGRPRNVAVLYCITY